MLVYLAHNNYNARGKISPDLCQIPTGVGLGKKGWPRPVLCSSTSVAATREVVQANRSRAPPAVSESRIIECGHSIACRITRVLVAAMGWDEVFMMIRPLHHMHFEHAYRNTHMHKPRGGSRMHVWEGCVLTILSFSITHVTFLAYLFGLDICSPHIA